MFSIRQVFLFDLSSVLNLIWLYHQKLKNYIYLSWYKTTNTTHPLIRSKCITMKRITKKRLNDHCVTVQYRSGLWDTVAQKNTVEADTPQNEEESYQALILSGTDLVKHWRTDYWRRILSDADPVKHWSTDDWRRILSSADLFKHRSTDYWRNLNSFTKVWHFCKHIVTCKLAAEWWWQCLLWCQWCHLIIL